MLKYFWIINNNSSQNKTLKLKPAREQTKTSQSCCRCFITSSCFVCVDHFLVVNIFLLGDFCFVFFWLFRLSGEVDFLLFVQLICHRVKKKKKEKLPIFKHLLQNLSLSLSASGCHGYFLLQPTQARNINLKLFKNQISLTFTRSSSAQCVRGKSDFKF